MNVKCKKCGKEFDLLQVNFTAKNVQKNILLI